MTMKKITGSALARAVWLILILVVTMCRLVAAQSNTQPQGELSALEYMANAQRVMHVHTTAELITAIEQVAPGDVIVVADGIYTGDAALTIFNRRADAEHPIVIMAENQGQAILKGTLRFDISYSSNVIIQGLVFNTKGAGAKGDIGAVTIKHSQYVRVTRNHFALEEAWGAHADVMLDWVVVRGGQSRYVRIDHNLFENKLQRGRFFIVGVLSATDTMPQHTRIDHNHFRDMAPLGINGMEAVVIGGGHPISPHYLNDHDAYTLFEYNLMERVDGECAEIISLKSSGNTIRYNTILDTNGSIYFRTGNRNTVYGNYIIGHSKPGSGGVRIYGEDQKVMFNYFSQLDTPAVWFGDGETAFFNPAMDVAPFTQVHRAEVSFNTFIDINTPIARNLRDNAPYTPQDSTVSNNLLYSTTNHKLLDPLLMREKGVTWLGNIAYAVNSSREVQFAGLEVTETMVRWVDPQLLRSGFYPDYIYSLSEQSPARRAALGAVPADLTDIEGRPVGTMPDVGTFAYTGYPPLRGPLTPQDVGPNALYDMEPAVLSTQGLVLTGITLTGDESGGRWYGPVAVSISTATSGLTQPVRYQVQVDEQAPSVYEEAALLLNTGELSDGVHQIRVTVYSGNLQDEGQVSFTVANVRILSPNPNEMVKGMLHVQAQTSLPRELIESVRLTIDDTVVYQDAELPESVDVPTTDFPDGTHTLSLAIQAENGVEANASTRFRTANFWHTNIAFATASGWFITTDDTQMSTGWRYINDPGTALFGDSSRLVRTSNTTEYCVWATPQLTQAIISIYARSEDIQQYLRLEASVDGRQWEAVPFMLQTLGVANGWYELELHARPQAGLYHLLRLTVLAGDLPAEDIQLGHAELEGLLD
jgi:hypothetical protein